MSDRYLKEKFCEPYRANDDFDCYFGNDKNEMDDFINAGRTAEYYAFKAGYELAKKELEERIKEAMEVIKFYSHRYDINGKENIFEFHQFDSACDACRETCYGLKAKEYLEKWK